MAVKVFGQFLLEKKAVTPADLNKAILLQETTNLKFGEMALSMGLITQADIERAHEAQKTEDLRLGELFVKLGILTPDKAEQVCTRQKNTHLYIGEALVKVGALSASALEGYLQEFKRDQAPYQVSYIIIPTGVPHPAFLNVAADLTYKMLTRVVGLSFRQEQCVTVERLSLGAVTASLDFHGDANLRYLLSVSAETQQQIAAAMLKEPDASRLPKELLDDAVKEFVNIVCGNIVAKAGQHGLSLSITTPQLIRTGGLPYATPPGQTGLHFPIHVTDGRRIDLGLYI